MTRYQWAAGLFSVFVCNQAVAGNQEDVALGNEAALTGGAVTAVAGDTGASWYNPAGLASVTRTTIDVSASAFVLRYRKAPGALETVLPFAELSRDLTSLEVLSIPSSLVVVRELGQGVTGAVGLFVPIQDQISVTVTDSFETTGQMGNGDGLFEESFDLNLTHSRYHVGPSLGWAVTDRLRVGASLFGVYESRAQESTFWSGAASSNGRRAFLLGQRTMDLTILGGQGVLGAQWEFVDGVHTGLTLRSPIYSLETWGERGELSTFSITNGRDTQVDLARSAQSLGNHTWEVLAPARVHLGVAFDMGSSWVSFEGEYAAANTGGVLTRDTSEVWNLRVGGRFSISESLQAGVGLFSDRSGLPRPEEVGQFRTDFYGIAGGVERLTSYVVADSDEPLVFGTTLGLRYALGVGEAGGLRFEPLAGQSLAQGSAVDVVFHELTIHVGSSLYF